MENKLRRGLALLMTLIMLISCAPMDALAAIVPVSGGTQTSDGFALKSIVKPPVKTHTYIFMNGNTEFARQIVKNGETLNNPGTPDAGSPNKEFTGWLDDNNQAPAFGEAVTVTETKEFTYHAQFDDVYFVFFTNEKGEVMVTEKGKAGDTIFTDGVTYPVGNEQTIVGWKDKNGNTVTSVKLEHKDVTLTAIVANGHWITYDSQGGTYVAPAFVKGNGTTTAPAAPTRPGYTFDHWSATVGGAAFTFGTQIDKPLTLYAVWTPNTNTQYTVIHWQENANDDDYSYAESETKTGTTGALTSAAAKSYTGFTAQAITQQTIAGDGSTIVNVGYKRNVYNVQFYNRNGKKEYTQYKITAKYGANIRDKWPTHEGSSSWYVATSGGTAQVGIDTMPLNGAKFYGPQTGSGTSTAYYYVQVLPGESGTTVSGLTYKLHHKDTSPGTNYSVTVEDQYPITGFTFNSSPSTSTGSNYNNAKFYYTRNSYNIVYVSGGQTVNTASKKFEESIADAGSYTPTAKPAGMEDYVFGGWYDDPSGEQEYVFTGKTMPAQNVTVYAKWNKPVYNGTIYLTIEGTTGSSITLNVPKGDTIETALNEKQAEIMAQVGEGYTWRGWRTGKDGTGEPFNPKTQITTDVTLYPYYTKDGTFTVKYVSGKNDVTAPTDGKKYAEDSYADLMSPESLVSSDGQYFLGWKDDKTGTIYQPRDKYQIKSNHANEQNVITLTAQWGARPGKVSLTYNANGGVGNDVKKEYDNNETVETISNSFTRDGYSFVGWSTNKNDKAGSNSIIGEKTSVQVDNDGDNVLYAIWTANADTKYTVEFYYEDANGNYTLNHKDETRTATTDTTVSVTPADKADKENGKYVFNADHAENVLSGNVAGNGSLVLKLYFKLNTASYTIHHYLNGTTVKVADDQTGAKTIGETLTANRSDALYLAYAAAEVAGYHPSQTITINATGNVITVYYTVPLTITAENANKTYDGQPLTQPDFTIEGLVNGDTKNNFTLSMTAKSTITNAGSIPNVIDTDTVKYNDGAIPTYYNVSYANGTLTVNKASATVTITGVNETAVYDGKQHEANGYNYSFTGKPNEITISLKPNVLAIARRTDVGTTYMGLTKDSFTVTSDNYNVTIKAVIDGYVTITPIETEIVITANSASKTYDGTPLTDGGFTFTEGVLVKGDVLTAVVEGSATNVGDEGKNVVKSYKVMRGDVDVTGNYTFGNSIDGKLTINKREVTLTSASDSKTYDGKPLTNGNVTIGGSGFADGEGATFNVTGTITNVGKMPNDFTYTLNEGTNANNYTITQTAGELEVTPVTDEVVVTITGQKVTTKYDGTEHAASGYDVSISNELYKKADFTFTGSAEVKATDASDTAYAMGLKDTDFANKNGNFSNVKFVVTDGSLTINKRTVTLKSEGGSKEYDGTPLTKPDVTVGGDGFVAGEVTDVKATGSVTFVREGEVTNAITYTTGEKFNADNYTITKNEGKLSITQRTGEGKTITVTAANGEKVYDGAPLTNNGFTHAGALVEGDTLTAVVEGSQTDVGSSDNVVTSYKVMRGDKDVTGNYTFGESVKGTLTVNKRPVTIIAQDNKKEYDGQSHGKNPDTAYVVKAAAENSGLVSGHTESNVNIAFTAVDAGTYAGKLAIDKTAVTIVDSNNKNVTGNYAIEVEPGTLTIEQHKGEVIVTIKGNTQQFTYDCTKHTVQGFTATVNNSLYNVNTDFTYDGNLYEAATLLAVAEGTNVGVYRMNLLSNHCVNLNKNFAEVTFEVQDGSLGIEKQSLAIEVANSSKVYGNADPAFADATLRFYNKTGVIIEPSADMKQELSGIDLTVHRADAGDDTIGTHVDVLDISKTAKELNDIYTNYEIGVNKGDFEITATEESLKVRANNYEGAYDGDGHGVVAKAYINGTVEAPNAVIRYYNEVTGKFDLTESPKFIDVKSATPGERTYTVRFQATLDGLTAEGSANVLIAPRKLVLSSGTESKDYDGLPLTSQEVVIIEGSIIKGQIYDLKATGSVTTVAEGMVKNTITYSTTDEFKPVNYEIEQKPGMLQIEKRDVSLTSETASKEYDGTPLTRENVTVERNGFVAGEVTDLRATGSVTYVDQGEVTNTITFTPTDKFDENNYSITKQEGKLSITKREGEGKTITVTAANDEKVYDGTPLTNNDFTHTGVLVDGDVLTAVVEGSATNVGDEGKNVVKSYVVKRGDVDVTGNYTFGNSIDGKLTINKRTVNLTSETASKEYDGKPLTKPVVTVTGNGFVTGEVSDIKATGSATFVDDGKVTNAITYTEGENFKETNYTISKEEGKLSITKRGGEGKTITVTANSDEKVYDGAPLTNNGFTHAGALVEGDELTAVVEGSQTDVGSSNNVVKSYRVMRGETDVTNNYTFGESIIGTLTVTPVAIELTAASASKAYDGTPLTNSDYTISKGAFVGEEGLAAVTIAGSQTLVGTSANTITGHTLKDNTLAQNYTITYQPGELKVTQNEKAITITANSHTWEYDGQPHSDGGYTVEYDGQTYKVEAGKTVTLQTGDIVKAKITKTVTNVSDSAAGNNTIDELTIVNAAGEDTKGQYKTVTLIPGTLTITKRGAGEEKVKITAADNTVEYDGQPHGAKLNAANQIEVGTSFTVTNLAEGHSVKTLAIDGSETDAGVYANKLVPGNAVIVDGNGVEVTANYDITYVPGTLTITKRGAGDMKVVLTAADNTIVYDGQSHGAKLNAAGEIEAGVSYTITNLANGHKVQSVVISGRETAVGEYENKLVPSGAKIVDAAGNDVTRNYVVGYKNGKLTITSPDTVIVTIKGKTDTVEYDGQKHEVNGYVVKSISNALYTDADFGFAEGAAAHAEGTDAGEYPMNLTKDSFVNKNTNFSAVTFVVTDGGLTITKRGAGEEKVKITAADNTVNYDGQPHGAKLNAANQIEVNVSYTTEYLVPGHKVQSVVISGTETAVGEYKNKLVPSDAKIVDADGNDVTKNYEITYVRGTLEIRKNETEIKVTANSHTWEYDGQAHSDGGYTVTYGNESYTVKAGESATLSTGDKVTAVVKGQVKDVDDTKAGNNEIVEWSVEHRDFYNNVTPANGTLTITPRKVTLTSASDSKPYDGTPLTKPEVAVTGDGFVAGEVTGITATGSVTYVSQGEVDNLITFTKNEGFKDSNYEIKERIGKLSIEALDVTIIITGPSAIREYKPGVTHTIVTGGSELDFVYGSDKVDGKIGVEGMVEGDKILPGTLKHTLEGMYVGEYEGVFTLFDSNGKKADKPTVMHDGVDVTENYKFSYNPGKLTITGKHMDGGKEVENEVPEKNYLLGQKIPFTITVRSVSKDELKDVTVTDPTATILPDRNTANPAYTVSEDEHTATITSLAPEAEVIVYAEHEVTEDDIINRYTNEATINWGNDEVKVSKTPSIEEENPEAELVKEIVLQDGQDENHKFKLGETVYFKITVTNTGNVTLNEYEVKEVLPGAAFIDGTGYTLNNDKTVATIEKMEPVKDGQEAPDSNQIVLYAQYTIKEEDLGNKELKNIVTADNSKPGEVPIPVDEAKSVSGQKIWKDEGNAFNTRPASITLTLMRKLGQNGAAEQYRTMQLGSNDSWRYSFDHLPKHDAQENEYFYWVVEEPVTGYDTAYETKDESHCDIVNNLQTYTLTIHYWQHKLGDTKMEQAFPDYVATLYYKQPYDVESPEREGIILDDMSQARISGTMPAHDLVIDVYYHRIAYRLTIHYIYQDGTMAHEDYTWTYWFNSTYNVPSPIIPGFTPSIDVIAGRMPSHGLELTVVYVGDGEIVIPDEDTSLGFKSYLNAGECFE